MSDAMYIMIGIVAVSWSMVCYHAVMAHLKSPTAFAFKPFWRNGYSTLGRKHLRHLAFWGLLSLILLVLAGCGDERDEVLRIADEIIAGRNTCVAEVRNIDWAGSAIAPHQDVLREKASDSGHEFSFSTTGFTFEFFGRYSAIPNVLLATDNHRLYQNVEDGPNLDGPAKNITIKNHTYGYPEVATKSAFSLESVFKPNNDIGSYFYGLPTRGKCSYSDVTYSFVLDYLTVQPDSAVPEFRYLALSQSYSYMDGSETKTLRLYKPAGEWKARACTNGDCAEWSTEDYSVFRWRARL